MSHLGHAQLALASLVFGHSQPPRSFARIWGPNSDPAGSSRQWRSLGICTVLKLPGPVFCKEYAAQNSTVLTTVYGFPVSCTPSLGRRNSENAETNRAILGKLPWERQEQSPGQTMSKKAKGPAR